MTPLDYVFSSAAKTNTQSSPTNKAVMPNAQTWLFALGLSTAIVVIVRTLFGFDSAFSAWVVIRPRAHCSYRAMAHVRSTRLRLSTPW